MSNLSKISVLLHRWGYDTKEYKKYSKEMQLALDHSHLAGREFITKYMSDIVSVISLDDYRYLQGVSRIWLDYFVFYSHKKDWDFKRAFDNLKHILRNYIPYVIAEDGSRIAITRSEVQYREDCGENVFIYKGN